MQEGPLAGVLGEDGLLDRVGLLEAVQRLEGEGALPVVLPAVGLLLGRELPEHLDLADDAVADERVPGLGLLREQYRGLPLPAPHDPRVVLLELVDLVPPAVGAEAEDVAVVLILGHND